MRHFSVLSVATAAALALSLPTLAVAAPAPIASSVWSLSGAPQCYAIANTVVIRGAVAMDGSHAGVPDAVVVLQYGAERRAARTNDHGIYTATFARSRATTIREVETLVPGATGTHVSVPAAGFSGSCSVAAAQVGALRQVHS